LNYNQHYIFYFIYFICFIYFINFGHHFFLLLGGENSVIANLLLRTIIFSFILYLLDSHAYSQTCLHTALTMAYALSGITISYSLVQTIIVLTHHLTILLAEFYLYLIIGFMFIPISPNITTIILWLILMANQLKIAYPLQFYALLESHNYYPWLVTKTIPAIISTTNNRLIQLSTTIPILWSLHKITSSIIYCSVRALPFTIPDTLYCPSAGPIQPNQKKISQSTHVGSGSYSATQLSKK
jgi:hypothetical protein